MVVTRKMTGLMASTVRNQDCSLLHQKPLTELMAAAWSSSTERFGQLIHMYGQRFNALSFQTPKALELPE